MAPDAEELQAELEQNQKKAGNIHDELDRCIMNLDGMRTTDLEDLMDELSECIADLNSVLSLVADLT